MTDLQQARERIVDIFNDSAAMEGNEPAFLKALEEYEAQFRADIVREIVEWLAHGAPVAAKWVREKFGDRS